MSWLYLLSILGSTLGVGLLDRRWRLAAFADGVLVAKVMLAGLGFFLCWDLVAIALGIYERGDSPGMTGLEVLPELPIEEIFFILFLCYLTLVLHGGWLRLLGAVARKESDG
ncbi:lycopene cyclase domain-containing protein [Nocardioides sp. zg-536]|uniref:Lycopene cyclase domain-containing protein n=1 Tax=Nocardioides faecalis TaxID=2803858 RepID=A0A939BX18_9ACTN|nr:lycopene cyclase domain-containing protein [Nocardioides faecalis]MBM9458923.1 lycopene cyclase domain-containing protein [Nocardioides faecalis]QVI60323.1 lycopene cyclase domain-containing protein [Nocardioides faecalis]